MRQEALKELAEPYLRAIRDRMPETFGLAVVDERRAVGRVLCRVEGPDRFCFAIEEGFAFPLHTSAPGKAFVAALPPGRRKALLKRMDFRRYTPNTITGRRAFETEIVRIQTAGYATDLSEETEGCHCGGVAILAPDGLPVAALWVTGMARRLSDETLRACVRTLQSVARKIEGELARVRVAGRAPKALSPCVVAARKALTERPCDFVNYAALAKSCGASYSTLRTAFKKETGTTLGQYRLVLRVEEARRLLQQTRMRVAEVAERTGFCCQKYFSSLFKSKTGMSPSAFRRCLRTDDPPRVAKNAADRKASRPVLR